MGRTRSMCELLGTLELGPCREEVTRLGGQVLTRTGRLRAPDPALEYVRPQCSSVGPAPPNTVIAQSASPHAASPPAPKHLHPTTHVPRLHPAPAVPPVQATDQDGVRYQVLSVLTGANAVGLCKVKRKLGRWGTAWETRLGSRTSCGRLGPALTSLLPACSLPCHGDWGGSAPPASSFPSLFWRPWGPHSLTLPVARLGEPLPATGAPTPGSDAASQSSCPRCAVLPVGASGPRYISRDWRGLPRPLDAAMAGRIYVSSKASSWSRRRKSRRHRKKYRSRRPAAHTFWDWLQDESDSSDTDPDWLPGGSQCQPIQSVYFFVADKYYRLNLRSKRVDFVRPRYPRPIAQYWLGCP
uniref:Uncharacterized protein n=1 Tax=Chrysemys picta bellii TaxID=8478 RepID=A0A8C3FXS3_CHRPI